MPGTDDATVCYLISVSTERRGAAQDKLWQLDQKPLSVVQGHLLFKFTPAAANVIQPDLCHRPAALNPPLLVFVSFFQFIPVVTGPTPACCITKDEKQLKFILNISFTPPASSRPTFCPL